MGNLTEYIEQFKTEQEVEIEIQRLQRNMEHLRTKYLMILGRKKIALINYKEWLKMQKLTKAFG